jgi:hypothetical protein
MVEISLSGSGEGPQAVTPGAYSTEPGHPRRGPLGLEARQRGARANEPRRRGSEPGEALKDTKREIERGDMPVAAESRVVV